MPYGITRMKKSLYSVLEHRADSPVFEMNEENEYHTIIKLTDYRIPAGIFRDAGLTTFLEEIS